MPFRQASLAFRHRLLVLRHEGLGSVPVAVPYHLRSFTRATRFACASTRSTIGASCSSSSLPTALISPAQAFGALRCPHRGLGAGVSSLIHGSAIKTFHKPRKISELRISNRR